MTKYRLLYFYNLWIKHRNSIIKKYKNKDLSKLSEKDKWILRQLLIGKKLAQYLSEDDIKMIRERLNSRLEKEIIEMCMKDKFTREVFEKLLQEYPVQWTVTSKNSSTLEDVLGLLNSLVDDKTFAKLDAETENIQQFLKDLRAVIPRLSEEYKGQILDLLEEVTVKFQEYMKKKFQQYRMVLDVLTASKEDLRYGGEDD